MEEDSLKFFPKGVTALIIYRAMSSISSFTELSDYLMILGKYLSKNRRIYRQRRNKVLKYAIDKLGKYSLVQKGKVPGTYIPLADRMQYLRFINENARSLYERTKFYMGLAIYEMVKHLANTQMELESLRLKIKSKEEYLITESKNEEEFNRYLQKLEIDFYRFLEESKLHKEVLDPFINGTFEPHIDDSEQLDLLISLFKAVKFEEKDIELAIYDIVFNFVKQSRWIEEEIRRFTDIEEDEPLVRDMKSYYFAPVHFKNEDDVSTRPEPFFRFFEVELEAIKEASKEDPSDEWIHEWAKEIQQTDHSRSIIHLGTTDPWWLIQFKRNVNSMVKGYIANPREGG